VLSAFMNNVAALALLMPVDIADRAQGGTQPQPQPHAAQLRDHTWAVWSR
jgi:hypothetical protein